MYEKMKAKNRKREAVKRFHDCETTFGTFYWILIKSLRCILCHIMLACKSGKFMSFLITCFRVDIWFKEPSCSDFIIHNSALIYHWSDSDLKIVPIRNVFKCCKCTFVSCSSRLRNIINNDNHILTQSASTQATHEDRA
jgi:hypothetical protein